MFAGQFPSGIDTFRYSRFAKAQAAISRGTLLITQNNGLVDYLAFVVQNAETFEVARRAYRSNALKIGGPRAWEHLFLFGGEKDASKWIRVEEPE